MKMSKYFSIIIGIVFLFFTGCISKELKHAASEAGKAIQAGKIKIAKGVATSTDKENYKSLNLEFGDFAGVPDNYDNEKLSSVGAFLFFKNLTPNDYLGYQKIQVTLQRGNATIETLYDIEKVSKVISQVKVVEAFINTIRLKSYKDYEQFIDTVNFEKDVQLMIYNGFMKMD